MVIYRKRVRHFTRKNYQLDLFDPDDGHFVLRHRHQQVARRATPVVVHVWSRDRYRLISVSSRLGFDISSDGKHHKLTFRGDPRYTFSMPKSSSDHRAGKNLVGKISTLLFWHRVEAALGQRA